MGGALQNWVAATLAPGHKGPSTTSRAHRRAQWVPGPAPGQRWHLAAVARRYHDFLKGIIWIDDTKLKCVDLKSTKIQLIEHFFSIAAVRTGWLRPRKLVKRQKQRAGIDPVPFRVGTGAVIHYTTRPVLQTDSI
jgi:hypothetical protein